MSVAHAGACRALGAAPGAWRSSSCRAWARPLRHLPALRPARCPLRTAAKREDDAAPAAGGLDPNLEVAVPKDQRPVNELNQLKQAQLYSWVRGPQPARAPAAPPRGARRC
jgi:hypothetical protein